jgi:transposase
LAWAKAQLKVSIAKQFMYVFADEKQFTIEDGKAGVWLYPWEERPTRRTKKFPKRVRVSGVITSEGAASLVAYPIDASFDAEEYKATLRTQHIPAVRAMLKGRQFTFIHDNASVHYAGVVAEWMEGEGVSTDATFPPYSPDLNLIENVWGVMAQHLSSQDFETERQLLHALRKEWDSLDLPYLQRLYWSFRDRLKAVIQAEGGNTKY